MGLDLHYQVIPDDCQLPDRDWMYEAIFGSAILNPETTTIGHPIRYLSPLEVYKIQDRLETIDLDMFGAHWHPTAMRASVYKIHQSEDDESFRYLQELFGENSKLSMLR